MSPCLPQPEALVFASSDGRFQLQLFPEPLALILAWSRAAGIRETGGLLAGYIADTHMAVVTDVMGPPPDSRFGRIRFQRGTAAVQGWLEALWQAENRRYYLGEWHYHPLHSAEASSTDIDQMEQIARNPIYHCPEPHLLILGGNPQAHWALEAYIFPQRLGRVECLRLPRHAGLICEAPKTQISQGNSVSKDDLKGLG